jgi:hypothetical protein
MANARPGVELAPGSFKGPVSIFRNTVATLTTDSNPIYHVMMPVDGFILYMTDTQFQNIIQNPSCLEGIGTGTLTLIELFRRIYHRLQNRQRNSSGRYSQPPLPDNPDWGPPLPMPSTVVGESASTEWQLCTGIFTFLCDTEIPLELWVAAGGAAALLGGLSYGGSSLDLRTP